MIVLWLYSLISAVSGTGKTTLMHELRRRGEEAHDTDTECIRCSKQTGKAIGYEEAKRDGYDWICPAEHLQLLKTQSRAKNIFLLGSIDNFDEVKVAADEYIWMSIPLELLVDRLNTREKEYGKSDSERQLILMSCDHLPCAYNSLCQDCSDSGGSAKEFRNPHSASSRPAWSNDEGSAGLCKSEN